MRRWLTLLIVLALPTRWKPPLLTALGHRVHRRARIRRSVIVADRLVLDADTHIGSFSLLACRRIVMRPGARIGAFNVVRGPLDLWLASRAAVGSRNVITRAAHPVSFGPAQFRLGAFSKLTSGHRVDCMQSVRLGRFSTVAGAGSQLWTHGYAHAPAGLDRARIDGRIRIGDSVYIGSHSCLSAGITIGDAVTVGSHSSVATDLLAPGLYVSQPLRHLPYVPYEQLARLPRMPDAGMVEPVYWKGRDCPHAAVARAEADDRTSP
jgi:UDP-3-O-[3-hydroxymyristoyl] glucosamine N-acyltransferase